ncbi:MAG TPA: M56 family metallopeptidase [Gemmatimonadaceae bacterium]|jgi:beta-lactamase regulating signal transducer with metallopeptidase domain|nr:M56 family metallopeptidase [Gemmatimonadaceae bacterium]
MMLPDLQTVVRLTDSTAGWLLTYLVHSTVILGAVWLIASRRRVSDTVREILWKFALLGGIVTATAQTVAAREPLGGQLRLAPRTGGSVAPAMRIAVRHDVLDARPRVILMRPSGTRWTNVLVVFWLATAGGGLLLLTLGHSRALRALGLRTSLAGTPVGHRLHALLARAGVDRFVDLTCSSAIASPVALPGDEVCLPRRALLELQPEEQDSMLAHEVAHLVRRDPQWLVLARAIEIVFFFQPLNRLARRRMQEVAEYLCDDWAVARTRRPVMLAKCLAAVAEWVGRAPAVATARLHPMSALVESRGSPLVRRVGRILGVRRAPDARTPRAAVAAVVCALALLAGVAPRVSVAHPAMSVSHFTVVRAVVRETGMMTNDAVFVFRTLDGRAAFDSLVERGIVRSAP